MKRSAIITTLACIGSFSIVSIIGVAIQRATGWSDPKSIMTLLATIAVVATYTEARDR